LGTVLWISFYAAVIVGTFQKQKLEEDLANKPTESSNKAMLPTAPAAQGSFSGTWFRRYRRIKMELGRRVSFPRGFQGGRASRNRLRIG